MEVEVEMESHVDLSIGFIDGRSVERGNVRDRSMVLSLRLAEMNTNMRHQPLDSKFDLFQLLKIFTLHLIYSTLLLRNSSSVSGLNIFLSHLG